jgi:hypothetical protein
MATIGVQPSQALRRWANMGGTDVSLDHITANLNLSGGADLSIDKITLAGAVGLGLNDLRINNLPPINVALTALPIVTNSTVNAAITHLPDINTNSLINAAILQLPTVNTNSTVNAAITQLPEIRTDSKVSAAITELPEIRTDSKVDLGLDNIRIRELPPLLLELAARPFRLHLPLNFTFCLEVLGVRLFKFSVCGEGMAIGEGYEPHKTEQCK